MVPAENTCPPIPVMVVAKRMNRIGLFFVACAYILSIDVCWVRAGGAAASSLGSYDLIAVKSVNAAKIVIHP